MYSRVCVSVCVHAIARACMMFAERRDCAEGLYDVCKAEGLCRGLV
jgi:hypothetical protein